LAFAAAILVAAPSYAQSSSANAPRAVTVIGGDPAQVRRCMNGVMAGDTSDAIVDGCTRALRGPRLTHAGEVQLLINRGVTYLRRRESERALADFDAAIAINRESGEAHLNRGAALVQLRRFGEAVPAITEALGLGVPEPHKAYYNRGAAREALGDTRGAFEDYSTALEIQPDWGPANAELARFVRNRREHLAGVLNEPAPQ
jgi:tetratricopeptide (TPR) repeat protein